MRHLVITFFGLLVFLSAHAAAEEQSTDARSDILVTFENRATGSSGAGIGAPYRNRKRYSIAAGVRRAAAAIADEYSLVQVDSWPIRSLSVFCIVYRVADSDDRDQLIERLKNDERVESVQTLQLFETGTGEKGIAPANDYDDTYAKLQHGLVSMGIQAAHQYSQGEGVRVAIIDSQADRHHEDLDGRLSRIRHFAHEGKNVAAEHGTAIASVIGANANNAKGIVGIAPAAKIELLVSCWGEAGNDSAVCDSFTLAKALDTLLADPPDIVNLSLMGPHDALLERLLVKLCAEGVIVVAALADDVHDGNAFPASLDRVIGVASSAAKRPAAMPSQRSESAPHAIYAPGDRILVAVPDDNYDFRSGSSLAAAHVSGVIALILAQSPDASYNSVSAILRKSQSSALSEMFSVNACAALQIADDSRSCI